MNRFESPYPSNDLAGIGGKIPEFKIILVGNSGVGKTCVVVRASKDFY
jgi:GTPase SAR1 family protein